MPNYTIKKADGSLGATEQKDLKTAKAYAKKIKAEIVHEGNDQPKEAK